MSLAHVHCPVCLSYSGGSEGETWPVVRYRIYLRRASVYYTLFVLVPTTIFACLSFVVFFMSFEVLTLLLPLALSSFYLPPCPTPFWPATRDRCYNLECELLPLAHDNLFAPHSVR